MKKHLAGLILLASVCAFAQNPYGNQIFPAVPMTATSQTSAPIPMGVSWSAGTITLTGTSLTTATFGVLVSYDNGSTYVAAPICTIAATPSCATTQTATANGAYQINLANVVYVKFVTSGTFTATSISLLLTASPNATISRNSSGGGGATTVLGTAPIVASTVGSTATVSCPTCSIGGSGTATPQGSACTVGQTYTQTFGGSAPQIWDCSTTGLNWINRTTGQVVYAGNSSMILTNAVACYTLTAGSGTTFADSCGSNNLTAGATPPAWNGTNGITFTGGTTGIVVPTALIANNQTYQACYHNTNTVGNAGLLLATTNFSGIGTDFWNNPYAFNAASSIQIATSNTSTPYYQKGDSCITWVLDSGGNNQLWAGTQQASGLRFSNALTFSGTGVLGNPTADPFVGILYKLYIYNTKLAAEIIAHNAAVLDAQMLSQGIPMSDGWTGGGTSTALMLAGLGDSLTNGKNDTTIGGFVTRLATLLNNNVNFLNAGVGGITASAANSLELSSVVSASSFFPTTANKVATHLLGTNDLPLGSIATEYGYAASAFASLHNAGYKVIGLTLPTKFNCTGTCESGTNGRQQYNAYYIAQQQYDGLVDIGSDPRFADKTNNWGFNSDGIHFNNAGYQVIAGRIVTEMNRLKLTGLGDFAPPVAYSATPNFDLSLGLHQSILLAGNVTYFTVSNYNQGTEFTIDFIQDATGSRTVGIGVLGSGATATAPLTGSLPVFTLGSGGSNYKAGWPPYIVASGGTCTTYPVFVPVLTAGAVSAGNGTGSIAGNCSVAPTLTFVSTEPVWHGAMTVGATANKVSTQTFHYDATTANVYASNPGVTNQ